MNIFKLALFLSFLTLTSQVSAKDLPSTVEFMNIFAACGMGSSINLEGNLKGSIEEIYQKGRVEGKASQQIMSDIIRLIPSDQRVVVYEKYLNCVDKRLGQIEDQREYKVGFMPGSYWVGNVDIGIVDGSRSTIEFLVDGGSESKAYLNEKTDGFDVYLRKGHHVFTMVADVRTDSGRRTRDRCSVSFDITKECLFIFKVKFEPFDDGRDRIASCAVEPA